MTTESSAAVRKALTYAEVRLSVHDIYKEALVARNGLDECLTRMSELRDLRRTYEGAIIDREMDLSADERSKHEGMSDAAMGRHLKIAFHQDSVLREARDSLTKVVSNLEGIEYDKAMLDTDIKIAIARMNELGGYMQYLAAIKITAD